MLEESCVQHFQPAKGASPEPRALHPVTTAGSPTAPTCPAETCTRTPEPSSSSSSAEQRAGSTLLIPAQSHTLQSSWQLLGRTILFFFLLFFFPSPDDAAFTAAAGGVRTRPQEHCAVAPTSQWVQDISQVTPTHHPALLPGFWGPTDATRILLVSSSGGHLILSQANGKGSRNSQHQIPCFTWRNED